MPSCGLASSTVTAAGVRTVFAMLLRRAAGALGGQRRRALMAAPRRQMNLMPALRDVVKLEAVRCSRRAAAPACGSRRRPRCATGRCGAETASLVCVLAIPVGGAASGYGAGDLGPPPQGGPGACRSDHQRVSVQRDAVTYRAAVRTVAGAAVRSSLRALPWLLWLTG
jgi:hypothetical protein